MRGKIYSYIKNHPKVSISEVTLALNIAGYEVLKVVEELSVDRFIKMCPPVPLCVTNDNSCYYTVTEKIYTEG